MDKNIDDQTSANETQDTQSEKTSESVFMRNRNRRYIIWGTVIVLLIVLLVVGVRRFHLFSRKGKNYYVPSITSSPQTNPNGSSNSSGTSQNTVQPTSTHATSQTNPLTPLQYTAGTSSMQTLNCAICTPTAARTYLLHVPSGYSTSNKYSLVLVLHGTGGTPSQIEGNTGFSQEADQKGFIVAYPAGIATVPNPNGPPHPWNNNLSPSQPDDLNFLRALVSNLTSQLSIDATRVYITGTSDGGGMTQVAGCNLSTIFAGIAPVSNGIITRSGCTGSRPMPMLAFHGTLDTTIKYTGGQQAVAYWAKHNGCSNVPPVPGSIPPPPPFTGSVPTVKYPLSSSQPDIELDTYTTGCTNAPVYFYSIINGNHEWPNSSAPDATDREINATDIMWNFFSSYHM